MKTCEMGHSSRPGAPIRTQMLMPAPSVNCPLAMSRSADALVRNRVRGSGRSTLLKPLLRAGAPALRLFRGTRREPLLDALPPVSPPMAKGVASRRVREHLGTMMLRTCGDDGKAKSPRNWTGLICRSTARRSSAFLASLWRPLASVGLCCGTLSWLLAALQLHADPFDCGSTGANGAMNSTSNTTLQLPPDGVFHCTTITIAPGATLTFSRNSLNTPVYLLATGDVVVNGTIDVSGTAPSGNQPGRGGPGGFDGGYGGAYVVGWDQGGDGLGPGGGATRPPWENQFGVYAVSKERGNSNVYGNTLLVPLVGGSGSAGTDGAPGKAGAGGGGAVLVASNSRIEVNGAVRASGGSNHQSQYLGPGSGGLFAWWLRMSEEPA